MHGAGGPSGFRDANGNPDAVRGRVAVIVGAGSVPGRTLAAGLARRGMKLVLADADPDALEQVTDTVAASGAEVLSMVCDVRRRAHVEELAEAAIIRFHGIHLLVNAAGLDAGPEGDAPVWSLDDGVWDAALGAGVTGTLNAVRMFMAPMLACADREPGYRGHIVNVLPVGDDAPAAVRGAAVGALTDALRRDVQRTGVPIGVSILRPGSGADLDTLTRLAIAALSAPPVTP
jgi:NAD(P)-dependent dehydrogenase (short-subunit alcohol dehydrogenase family)